MSSTSLERSAQGAASAGELLRVAQHHPKLNNIPVEIYTSETKHPPYFYAYKHDDEAYITTVKALKQITGQSIATFQGIYTPKETVHCGQAGGCGKRNQANSWA